jgi:hypothetical protein
MVGGEGVARTYGCLIVVPGIVPAGERLTRFGRVGALFLVREDFVF